MSADPTVIIRLDDNYPAYHPGQILSGQYWLDWLETGRLKAVEVSVLWYTDGKGDEDMSVHQFWRSNADNLQPFDPGKPMPFSTKLPNSPLSYQGQIVNLQWCVRVRAFPYRGKEILGEKTFQLGDIPPVRTLSSA
jgi:hypothetical protein